MNVKIQGEMTVSDLVKKITSHFVERGDRNLKGLENELANLNVDAIEEFVDFDSEKYCKTVVHRVDQFEVMLICWLPHQQTPFHSHPANGCLMKILKGQLNEKRTKENGDKGIVLVKNEVTFLGEGEMHTITNMEDRSISLHIYSPSRFYN